MCVSEPSYLLSLEHPKLHGAGPSDHFAAPLSQEMTVFLTTSCVTILLPANNILSYSPALFA